MGRYEISEIKAAAKGHWPAILNRVAGIGDDYLNTRSHGPCPKCGGTDRWRFTNLDDDGGAICNQCGKFGDGLATVQWYLGIGFPQAIEKVAEFIGVKPANLQDQSAELSEYDPLKKITLDDWSEGNQRIAKLWCLMHKQASIAPEVITEIAFAGDYKTKFESHQVIAFPVVGEHEVIGYSIYDAGDRKLPSWKGKQNEWVKVKTIKRREPKK